MQLSDFQKGVIGNIIRIMAVYLAGRAATKGMGLTPTDIESFLTLLVPVGAAAWGIYNKFKKEQVIVQQAHDLGQPVEVAVAKVASPLVATPSVNTPMTIVPVPGKA